MGLHESISSGLRQALVAVALFAAAMVGGSQLAYAQLLPKEVMDTLADIRLSGTPTDAQEALIYAFNDDINSAANLGQIDDFAYQQGQRIFDTRNQAIASDAAKKFGVEFKVQQRAPGARFAPGTDSDYILTVKSKNPVGTIKNIQSEYNRLVNEYIQKNLKGAPVRNNWHNKLDVDFMADPQHVTAEEFKQIAKINNDAYKRQAAADYERISRAGGNVTPEQFAAYAEEMKDFIAKKEIRLAELKSKPGWFSNPSSRAEVHRMMAQQQKYISRIESATTTLRKQFNLPQRRLGFQPELTARLRKTPTGDMWVMKTQSTAQIGAQRGFGTYRDAAFGASVAKNSVATALDELAFSMAEAHKRFPNRFPNAHQRIAAVMHGMPPSQQAALIERIRSTGGGSHTAWEQRWGESLAKKVASDLRQRNAIPRAPLAAQFDQALQRAFRINNNLTNMGKARKALNQTVTRITGGLKGLALVGQAVEVYNAASAAKDLVSNLYTALNTENEQEANAAFGRAGGAFSRLATSGGTYVLFSKVPTLGAMYGAWTIGYDGTRYFMENTETGQMIDNAVTSFFDTTFYGGEDYAAREARQSTMVYEAYLRNIQNGGLVLNDGYTQAQLAAAVRSGDMDLLGRMVSTTTNQEPGLPATEGYVAYYTEKPRWIFVGSVADMRKPSPSKSLTWGGMSDTPVYKKPMLGGRTFDLKKEAVAALAQQIGPGLKFARHPLAFPKYTYVFADANLSKGLESDPAFKPYVDAAYQRYQSGGQ